jgi:hypothetical protein
MEHCFGALPHAARQVKKHVGGWTEVDVSDDVVPCQHFFQNAQSFDAGRKPDQADAGETPQPRVGLIFIPESTLEFPVIKAQSDFSNVKTLRVGIAGIYSRQE